MTEHFKVRSKVYATVVIRWALIVALVFCAVMASGVYVTNHLLARVYSATAVMQVSGQPVSAEAYGGWAFSSPRSRAIQVELKSIESPEIMQAVVTSLALDKAWADRIFDRSDPLTLTEGRPLSGKPPAPQFQARLHRRRGHGVERRSQGGREHRE